MKVLYESGFKETPREVRNQVMIKYKLKYSGISPVRDAIWRKIIEYLPEDHIIYSTLNRHKQECLGNIPRGRDSLDILEILEGLTAESGDKAKYLDSNDLWQDEEFRTKFDSVNIPERVILLTTESSFD